MSKAEALAPKDTIEEQAKQHFAKFFSKRENPIYPYLPRHVDQAEKWANIILADYPEADRRVVILAIWLHDIGWAIGEDSLDHAVKSEEETFRFLTDNGLSPETVSKVAHCVRAHRNRNIHPETLEAKIVAAADSASHFTDINYIVHVTDGIKDYALGKLERDYKDIGLLPGLQEKLTPLYLAWKQLLSVFPD